MKNWFAILIVFVCSTASFAQHRAAELEGKSMSRRLSNRAFSLASNNFSVHYAKCEWQVDPAKLLIAGSVTHHFIITAATNNIVFDLHYKLKVDSVVMGGAKLPFSQQAVHTLTIQLPGTYIAGSTGAVQIFYKGVPNGSGFGSFIQSSHNGKPVIWTLSEPYGAKDWWPCRNGLDDKLDSIDIYITHPNKFRASSNGVLASEKVKSRKTISHYKHRYPIATYLVAFAVTNYSVITDYVQLGTRTMPVVQHVYPEDSATFSNAIPVTLNGLRFFNEKFSAYPFVRERYGQTQFGWGGGMEHQTNSFITNTSENLMIHELAHQWFGNKITCGSWEDIWLNEGFATYCADVLYTEQFNPTQYKTNIKSLLDFIVYLPGGSVKVDDTTNVGRIFDGRLSYDKGAFLLRMLRWTIGDTAFFGGIKKYLEDPALKYGYAKTSDLKRNMENVSGKNLDYFFQQWYEGQGYPSFTVNWLQRNDQKVSLLISQVTSHPSVAFFRVPLALRFKNATQEKTIVVDHIVNNQVVIADIGFRADSVLIDPDKYIISKNNTSIKDGIAMQIPELVVSPNPFTTSLQVSLVAPAGSNIAIQLISPSAQPVANAVYKGAGYKQTYPLNISAQLSPGVYTLHVTVNGTVVTRQLVKQ